jgi:hypothetical protein
VYTYLVLACEENPFNMGTIEENRDNAFKGWQALQLAKYDVQETPDDAKLPEDYFFLTTR